MRRMLSAAFVAMLTASSALPAPAPAPKPQVIDVAICLDTSGSMNGLIESAKVKLWTIVNDLAKIQPAPTLRVALYQYGFDPLGPATGWVRQELELSQDLDEVYKKLNALRTNGGTELVARVSQAALNDLKWSDDPNALRMVFVCGNEAADQDKENTLQSIAEIAKKKGVFVNTIFCGPSASHEVALWREFAVMAGGNYSNIDQNLAARQPHIKTPHDEQLLKLNDKLNGTYVVYGGKDGAARQENQVAQDANAAKASPTVAVDRLSVKNGALYRCDTWDLVDRMKNDPKFDIKSVKEEDLCEELKKVKPEEREAYIKKKAAEREAIRKEIDDLNAKRSAYIAEEVKKLPKNQGDKAFDEALKGAIREQANKKGIKIPD